MNKAVEQTRVYQMVRHWRNRLRWPQYRQSDRQARAGFEQFCRESGGWGLRHNLLPHSVKPKTVLIVSINQIAVAKLEGILMKAFQMAGFDAVVLGTRRYDILRYYWLAGAKAVVDWHDFGFQGDSRWVNQILRRIHSLRDWLALDYQGVHVGRLAISSTMRTLKKGQLDLADPSTKEKARGHIEFSVRCALAGSRLLEQIKPDCILILDQGYAGQGELFDLALMQGIDVITWQAGYKSNLLNFKRYKPGNQREHHFSLSAESWRRMCSIPWQPAYGRNIRQELFRCYQSQDWFSQVGTQVGKKILSKEMTRQTLGLSADRKAAFIFPHIFWDGSFFWGEDLFDDYADWFIETVRSACANPRLDWVIKIHPAHVVNAKRENLAAKPQEIAAIEKEFGTLPPHVKLVYPDTDVSTYSIFEIADYTVTVRGTVGIESALFGVPVVTGGTGGYDRRGFTLDSATRGEYFLKLATLESHPRLSPEQVELAERFAYGVFFCRPLGLSCASLEFERDAVATHKIAVNCQTREQWLGAPDVQQLAGWIADGKTEDMLTWPFPE